MRSWPLLDVPPLDFKLPPLSLFDTKSNSVRALPHKDIYRIYVCGITPYDATHLGHAATYIVFDLVGRYLRAMGSDVLFVENTTDIDDPLLDRAERDGVDWRSLALSQIDLFRQDMTDLHIIPPTTFMGVTESMDLIIEAISQIVATGATYYVEKDLYLDISRDPNFGSRSHLSSPDANALFAERGGDPNRPGKANPLDPLLWKADEPTWPSPFGPGRPGWHIECQAIALRYLGRNDVGPLIDIQGGGSDLIFPHHEMSAAQTYVQTGRELADFYVHAGMIGLDGEKMSKSKGNLLFVSRMIANGVEPMTIKLALLSQHYQSDRMWTSSLLTSAENLLANLRLAMSKPEVAPTSPVITAIIDSLARNLDTPSVIEHIRNWIEETRQGRTGGRPGELSRALDTLLGLAI